MANGEQNGWNEYSKLVIAELERLNDGITNLNVEIQDLKQQIAELRVKEDFAKELWRWKKEVDEVASPSQLESTMKDVAELKTFKTSILPTQKAARIPSSLFRLIEKKLAAIS